MGAIVFQEMVGNKTPGIRIVIKVVLNSTFRLITMGVALIIRAVIINSLQGAIKTPSTTHPQIANKIVLIRKMEGKISSSRDLATTTRTNKATINSNTSSNRHPCPLSLTTQYRSCLRETRLSPPVKTRNKRPKNNPSSSFLAIPSACGK